MVRIIALTICIMLFPTLASANDNVGKLNTAIQLIQSQRLEEARKLLIEVATAQSATDREKGRSYYMLTSIGEDLSENLIYAEKAVELEPTNATYLVRYANLLYRAKDYNATVETSTKAIAISPVNADAYAIRGIAYRELAQYPSAIEDLNKTLSIKPTGINYARRGITYFHQGDGNNARNDLLKALDFRLPNGVEIEIAYYLGRIYLNEQKFEEAEVYFTYVSTHSDKPDWVEEAKAALSQITSLKQWM